MHNPNMLAKKINIYRLQINTPYPPFLIFDNWISINDIYTRESNVFLHENWNKVSIVTKQIKIFYMARGALLDVHSVNADEL